MGEIDTGGFKAIEVRRFDIRVPRVSRRLGAPLVGEHEDDVRAFGLLRVHRRRHQPKSDNTNQTESHDGIFDSSLLPVKCLGQEESIMSYYFIMLLKRLLTGACLILTAATQTAPVSTGRQQL